MQRVRVSTADAQNGTAVNSTLGEVEDGFVIRGVHKQEPGMSAKETQLRGHSFLGTPAPVYRPRPRPHHLSKESTEARHAESRRWQHGAYGMSKFKVTAQLARLAAHSKLNGQRGVGAAVANQIVAKKWKEIGNLLKHTAGGVTRIRALVDKDKRTYLAAAQEALRLAAVGVLDVKLTVRSEQELQSLSYLQQGDASMYTPEMMVERLAIKSTTHFREAVRAWWKWLPLCTLPTEERLTEDERLMPLDMRGMTKPVYCAMAALIQRVLLPRFGLKPNPSYEPEEDWSFDCRGKRFLLFQQLLNALFELADMWCPTVSETDYVTILTELLEQCQALEGRHGLFSKLLQKYQRRFGAREEQSLPISGGYVHDFDTAAGRAVVGGGVGAAALAVAGFLGGAAPTAGGDGGASGSAAGGSEATAVPAPLYKRHDEADAVLKALSDDDDDEDHRAATNWWAKIMERNRRFMAAKAIGMADEAAEAAAAAVRAARGPPSASPPTTPLPFPMAVLGDLYVSPNHSETGAPPPGKAPRRATFGAQDQPPRLLDKTGAGRMGKGLKGQVAPAPPSAALVATLRDAVTDALVEVGASTDANDAASVLTEDGTISYQQVGPHTLAELIKVLVDYKRMNTRHIRALIGTSFTRGSADRVGAGAAGAGEPGAPGGDGGGGLGSSGGAGSRVVSRKKIAITLPTIASTVGESEQAAAATVAAYPSPTGGGGGGSVSESPRFASKGGNVGGVAAAGAVLSLEVGSVLIGGLSAGGGGADVRASHSGTATATTSARSTADGANAGGAAGDAGASAVGSVTASFRRASLFVSPERSRAGGGADADGDAEEGDDGGEGDDYGEDDLPDNGGPQVFAARPHTPSLDSATLCAIRATLQDAGVASGEMSSLLASHGLGLATDVQPQALAQVAKVLAEAGFTTEAIVAFLFPPESEAGFSITEPLSDMQLEAMRLALSKAGVDDDVVDLVRSWTADIRAIQATSAALEASGFTPLEVQRFIAPAASTALIDALHRRGLTPAAAAGLLRRDGTGLSLELTPDELAEAADAMAAAGFTAVQLVQAIGSDAASVPPLEPSGLEACREALLSEGFSEEELEEVVLTDNGTALQDGIGAATMARVVGSLARGGLTADTIRRFLRYDFIRAAKSRLPQHAISAMQSAITGAGLMGSPDGGDGEEARLLPDGSGVAPDAGVGMVAQIGGALVEAMFKPAQIRAFLMPDEAEAPAAAAAAPDPGPLGKGADGAAADNGRKFLSPREIVVFRSVLMASGFTTQDLMDLIRADGRGLDPDADSDLAAKAVAALSAAGFRGHEMQLFVQLRDPAPAMTPSEAAAARSALVTAGFVPGQLEELLRRDGLGLAPEPEPDPYVMAQVAVVLAEAGFPAFHICQYLSPTLPLVPVKVLAVGRYFGHSVSGRMSRPVSQAPSSKPWAVLSEDGRLMPEDDVSDDEEDRRAEEEAAAAAAAERRRRKQVEAEAETKKKKAAGEGGAALEVVGEGEEQAKEGEGKEGEQEEEGEKAEQEEKEEKEKEEEEEAATARAAVPQCPLTRLALAPGMIAEMQATITRRCKGLNTKQMRQLAAQMADPAAAGAAANGGAAGGSSWLPLDADVTARAVRALSYEGFSPDQIRRFFMQPAIATVATTSEAAPDGELFDHITPGLLFLIRALLKSAGFTEQHLSNLLSADRRRLDPDWDSESAAMMVAAMARTGWSTHIIRLMLTTGPPVPALTPNELGTINEALLEAGFSRRQLRLMLRPDHSGPGRSVDEATMAQMATALAQGNCPAGHMCQFLGPSPASFTKPVPLPLLTPLLAAINGPPPATIAAATAVGAAVHATFGGTGLNAMGSSAISAAGSGAVSILPAAGPAGGMFAASGAANLGGGVAGSSLDNRSVMDIRNVAASCGISSRTLAEMIRPDGRGLQPHADPRVIERVGLHMVNQGFTQAQVYRFLLPHGGCEYGHFDPPTSAAVRAVLLAAGFSPADLKSLLTGNNTTIVATASSPTLAAIAYSLASSGATADQIRHFMRPPPGAVAAAAAAAAAGVASKVAETILGGLMASGYADHQLDLILRRDGTALRADVGPLRLAQMVAALAAADVPSSTIRLFVRPLGGVQPSLAVTLKAALEHCPGFNHERVEAAFSPEAYELGPEVAPTTLADIASALSTAGIAGDVIRQLFSLPPGMGPAPDPAPSAQSSLPAMASQSSSGAPQSEGSGASAAPPLMQAAGGVMAPALRGRVGGTGGGGFASLPLTKVVAMKDAITARSDPNNPTDLLDLHDPAKVIVMLADAGFPSEDIRAFVSSDPKVLVAPTFRGTGPVIGGNGPAAGGNGFVAAVLARGGGPMASLRMSDPGLARSNTRLRHNMTFDRNTSRLAALALVPSPGPVPNFLGPRITVDGTESSRAGLSQSEAFSPLRGPAPRLSNPGLGSIMEQQQPPAPPAWPDFEYRPGGEASPSKGAPSPPGMDAVQPLSAEQLLAWLGGVRELMPEGQSERHPPGLEQQFAAYLRRALVRLVGSDVLRAAVTVGGPQTGAMTEGGGGATDTAGNSLSPDGRGTAKTGSKSRTMVKLMAVLLGRLLGRTRGSNVPVQAWPATGDGGGRGGGADGDGAGVSAARAQAVASVLSSMLHRSQGSGGGLPSDCVAPTLLRFLVVNAARQGLLSEAETADLPPPRQPALAAEPSAASSTFSRFTSNAPDGLQRRPELGLLRPLPPGYARAWGEAPLSRRLGQPGSPCGSASGSLLDGRFSSGGGSHSPTVAPTHLLYRSLPQRVNPTHSAAKAGSPRETLPPWPLQRAFVHHPAAAAAAASAHHRLNVELPGSPSGTGSPASPSGYKACGSPQLPGHNAHQNNSSHRYPGPGGEGGATGLVLPPARLGGARGTSQPASPRAGQGLEFQRPSSSSSFGAPGGEGGGDGVMRLPALLTRSASVGRSSEDPLPAALASPGSGPGGRSNLAQGLSGTSGSWAGPPAEALFSRLLAEVLRWLEAPSDDLDGSSARKASGGGWQAWLAAQKVRMSSQMAHLGLAAGQAQGQAATKDPARDQRQRQQQQPDGNPPRRTSDPGSTFMLTQQGAFGPWSGNDE